MSLNINNYPYKTWGETFPNHKVTFDKLYIEDSWGKFFDAEMKKPYFKKRILDPLSEELKESNGTIKIFPYPELLFNAFNTTPIDDVKVVIIGQDPYFNCINHKDKQIPQAMGLSFSVPCGMPIPSSLSNIYKNLKKYNHISKSTKHGNLKLWAVQGCLMLNASLTVRYGEKNSHSNLWRSLTDKIIKYISDKKENIVFVIWGGSALRKLRLINSNKHKVIISSHPSGLSYNKKLRNYPPFSECDHFGEINNFLMEQKKRIILWNTI
uniref:Uracil-DNA glycosylase n=1 Tax=Mimivirus LCMiAC02 TaxID=2506609 RepID=A0A481Z109_9VIRU|nr:MAG: uracil-DNA glycosylase [Mimivirus LCMiAC02]